MAKQLVNPIERHVEKVVVAISATALLGAAALFLISSPNKLELGDTVVTPSNIDVAVADHAEEIRATLRNHQPTSVVPQPLADEFIEATKQTPPSVFVAAAPIGPTVPLIDPPITKVADFTLVKVIQPARPEVTSGRSTAIFETDPLYRPLDWATVSAVFDRKAQSELQKHTYGAANGVVYTTSPEIQRRAQRGDGTWSDDDWTSIASAPAEAPLPIPTLVVIDGPNGPTISLEQKKRLERVLFELTNTEAQRNRLRPFFYELVNGDAWSFPILTSLIDVLKQDDEVLYPDKAPSANPEDLYGLLDAGSDVGATSKELTPTQQVAADMQRAKEMLARAKKDKSKFDARAAGNLFFDIKGNAAANSSLRSEAKKLEAEAEELVTQLQRMEMVRGGKPASGSPSAATGDKAPVRQLLPTQQVWAHDAAEGSIEGGKTYQYQIRFRIYNLFAGEAGKFENPDDAKRILVASEWSPPSEPVSIEPWQAFFVTADDEAKKQVGCEFFRWFYGAWVKSRRHKFGVGELVSVTQRTTVPSLANPGDSDSIDVDYNAAVSVLDVDFSRAYRERRKGSSPGGIRFAAQRDETAVVLVDSEGHLTERLIPRDKDHPAKKELGEKLYKGSR